MKQPDKSATTEVGRSSGMKGTAARKRRPRILYATFSACAIAAGLATRAFPAWLPAAWGKYPGDCLWAVMVFFALGVLFPRLTTMRLAGSGLVLCFTVETIKLLPWDWLRSMRQTTVGHLVLGNVFTWQNYLAYSLGIACAAVCDMVIPRRSPPISTSPGQSPFNTSPSM